MHRLRRAAVVAGLTAVLFGCAPTEQQQTAAIVRETKAKVQSISQNCMRRMLDDHDLDPIRAKIELSRSGMSGAPPPAMLADQSRPTPEEKLAVAKWESLREACVQEEIQYASSLSFPPDAQPLWDKLLFAFRQADERTGLLAAALYGGRLTYGEFAAERMKNTDRFMAWLGGPAPPAASGQPSIASSAATPPPGRDEIPLQRRGSSYYVSVSVNGFPPIPFVLDTGADFVALPAEVVLTLVRAGTLRSSDFIGHKTFVMADGSELPSLTFKIRELRVGQHVIRNAVGSLNPALTDPLLGESFLSRFASVSIDYRRRLLMLR